MNLRLKHLILAATLAAATDGFAAVHYVDIHSASATPPYSTWNTAAASIQNAIDAAVAGDEIVVTNGTYATGGRVVYGALTNRVAVTKALSVRSVNGPRFTLIQGYRPPGGSNTDAAIRGVYLTNGASLMGFTVTNGTTRTAGDYYQEQCGGGIWCESAGSVISNCVVTGNSAAQLGGGVYSGTLYSCLLATNSASFAGGGVYQGWLSDCVVAGNSASEGGGSFGAVWGFALNRCLITGNSADYIGGGSCHGTLNNCLLTGNSALVGGGEAGGLVLNCTIVGNTARAGAGASGFLAGTISSTATVLSNCIVYFNFDTNGPTSPSNTINYDSGWVVMGHCCTTPQPGFGDGNITLDPQFVDVAHGNFRLKTISPCINAGDNGGVASIIDFDGRPRIASGTVDLGAFEFQPGINGLFIAWLQQFGLPVDGSADFTDSDGDGMNNWREWVTGTDPTNPQSVLRVLPPTRNGANIELTWQSVVGVTYFVERAADLSSSTFIRLNSSVTGQTGTTSFVDTAATGDGSFFYRVGVFYPPEGP